MKNATLTTIAITFVVLYISVTQLMVKETNRMIREEAKLLEKNIEGEISEEQYIKESSKIEKNYRKGISQALEPLIREIQKVIGLLKPANKSVELENLSRELENATGVLK